MDRAQSVRAGRLAAVLAAGACLSACGTIAPKYAVQGGARPHTAPPSATRLKGTDQPYQVGGIWYVPHEQPHYNETGIASWYGDAFNMKATADGEVFDMNQFSAAHTTLPLPSMVEVTNLDNGRKIQVRVNDRGPFVGDRIIDLSHAAARELGYDRAGLAHVRVRYVGPAPLAGPAAGVRYAKASPTAPAPTAGRRPADEEIFEQAALGPAASTPLVPRPEAVTVSTLASLPSARPARSEIAMAKPATPTHGYRIQAAAFGDQENARRAAAQLSGAGAATVEPMQRGDTSIYRVVLPGPEDEAEAFALRDRVAEIGFADAQVVRP